MSGKHTNTLSISLIDKIKQYSDTYDLLPFGARIIVGLSGGADSTFLLHVLHIVQQERNLTLIAAHLNHGWRQEADADEAFCRQLASSMGITCVSKRLTELGAMPMYNGSQEAVGRMARRSFLESIRQEYDADYIALAHNAQDQIETFFIRLIRGSSLSGLVGMRPRAGIYIRPLLYIRADVIRQELTDAHLPFVEDISNTSPIFLRNRIRQIALPALRSCDSRFDQKCRDSIDQLAQTEEFLITLTDTIFQQISTIKDTVVWIDTALFSTQHIVMQYRLIVHWLCAAGVPFEPTETFLAEIIRFLLSDRGGKHILDPTWYIHKIKKRACIISLLPLAKRVS
ncbi:MAG TPA: tRNA lysidine(34) synthetase TilS [Candidatus Babeliales bacterium]|jgi:tRNA(Ile)-lysidine synthase|nr:tRNA lysidine(34) synthetase TilS [Candidatus Babeliales bacterium]